MKYLESVRDEATPRFHAYLPRMAPLLLALASPAALAERPMAVDDAGTLDKGGAKLEFGWSRDDQTKGWDGAAGFAPVENLELEVSFVRSRDHSAAPATKISTTGFAAKWVPLQAEAGMSAGLKLKWGGGKNDDQAGTVTQPQTHGLTGLATWTFESDQLLHFNVGRSWERVDGATTGTGNWGIGLDQPLTKGLSLTLETYGLDQGKSRPDKQIGLRWEVADGLKLSIAGGSGNNRSFAQAGVAWEF